MDPISNVDRIALLLRQKLLERARTAGGQRAAFRQAGTVSGNAGLAAVLAAQENADERSLRRAVVQNILVEQFGEDLVNSAPFQQTIDRVADTIGADRQAAAALTQAIDTLKSAK